MAKPMPANKEHSSSNGQDILTQLPHSCFDHKRAEKQNADGKAQIRSGGSRRWSGRRHVLEKALA